MTSFFNAPRGRLLRSFLLAFFSGWLAAAFAPAARADAISDFYKGKTITIIVGGDPGGSYDIYARMLSRHLPRHLRWQSNHHDAVHAGSRVRDRHQPSL